MRVLVVQLYGDYREAHRRLSGGGDEFYYGQRYSVDVIAEASRHVEEIATLSGFTDEPYNELLAPKVRAIGAGFRTRSSQSTLLGLVEDYDPSHLVIRTANPGLLNWAERNRRPSIAVLAESLPSGGPRTILRNRRIVRGLNREMIAWVGAYGLTAAHDYVRLGVRPEKIIPWDFLFERPSSFPVKPLRSAKPPWTVFYVGSLVEAKGVGDIMDAIAHLKSSGHEVRLKLVGNDADGAWAARAAKLGIGELVDFLGFMPTKALVPLMAEADAVLVPSWHSYSEGFPLTIVHALESCSPLIASDHPMFRDHLEDGVNSVIFPAGDSIALAESMRRLLSDPVLYEKISANCEPTWQKLSLPVKFGEFVDRWIHDSAEDRSWFSGHQLTSGIYPALGSR